MVKVKIWGSLAETTGSEYVYVDAQNFLELLENLKNTCPKLVDTVVPKILPLNQLTGILKILLAEAVPITDLRRVLELISNINIS